MSRWALFVDAGWLFAAGATSAFGERKERRDIGWDPTRLTGVLTEHASKLVPAEAELLRIYWYDGSPNRLPIGDQHVVAGLTDVKLRLGRTARDGQKGVDGLIIHDLITHAYRRTIDDAVVLSGDEDLLDAIESAQANGTRVHLLEIPIGGIAEALLRAVDRRGQLDDAVWQEQFRINAPAEAAAVPGSPTSVTSSPTSRLGPQHRPAWLDQPLPSGPQGSTGSGQSSMADLPPCELSDDELVERASAFATAWAGSVGSAEHSELLAARPYLPKDIDARLLREAAGADTWLNPTQRRALRDTFWSVLADSEPGVNGGV